MLIDIGKMKPILEIPHKSQFDLWQSRLTANEVDEIFQELENRISGDEIHTSSWIPGSNWQGTKFQVIYEKACNFNEELAGKCFGLFVWVAFMKHCAQWAFGRYEKDGIPIQGMTYFRVHL
jgi:hypothetical protein